MTIEELEGWAKTVVIKPDFNLKPGVVISDPKKFIDRQLEEIRAHGIKSPAYERLMELAGKVEGNN